MQTASMNRTSALIGCTRSSANRSVFQTRTVLPLRHRVGRPARAESDNTGPSITNSGKTERPDSYERIEAPVRNNQSADQNYAYGGKPIGERQSDVDRLLVDRDEPREQSVLHTNVAFPDALRFKGAAPEIINSRLAMLGVVAALLAEIGTGKTVFQQIQAYPQTIAVTFAIWIVASLVPILRGIPRRGNTVFRPGRELINGRIAMLGFVALLATEYFSGQTVFQFYHLQ